MITSVSSCKAFRAIEQANTEHDAELQRLIDAVEKWLEGQCGRTFDKLGSVTEYYSGEKWRDRLLLARPPLSTITNIWDDPLRIYATPLSSSLYVIEDVDAGVVRLDGYTFLSGIRNIKITYQGGFSASSPDWADLEQAANEMVWAAREKGIHNLVGVRSRSVADGSVQYVNLDWDSIARSIVEKYSLRVGVH